MKKWKKIGTQLLYESKFVAVFNDEVILPNKLKIDYTRIELPDFVSIISTIDDKIVMIEILRYPQNNASLEIPSGHVEDHESPEEAAFRELEEESGYKADKIMKIGYFYPLSRSTQRAHLFFASSLTKVKQKLEETEQIKVKLLPIEKVKKMLLAGKITHPPTIIALQNYLLKELLEKY
ncbi:MAG: NUDIX hydrolase [Candidatus Bathyarchaeota archaeon]